MIELMLQQRACEYTCSAPWTMVLLFAIGIAMILIALYFMIKMAMDEDLTKKISRMRSGTMSSMDSRYLSGQLNQRSKKNMGILFVGLAIVVFGWYAVAPLAIVLAGALVIVLMVTIVYSFYWTTRAAFNPNKFLYGSRAPSVPHYVDIDDKENNYDVQ